MNVKRKRDERGEKDPSVTSAYPLSSRIVPWICASVVILLYLPSWTYKDFISDDRAAIEGHPLLRSTEPLWSKLVKLSRSDFWGNDLFSGGWTHKSYRPVITLSFWLNSFVSSDARGYHAINTLIHAANSYLVFLTGRRILKLPVAAALVASVVFGLHATTSEAVLYLIGRADMLSSSLVLLCVLFPRHKYWLFALAALCKETSIMMFPVVLLWAADRRDMTKFAAFCISIGLLRYLFTGGTKFVMSYQDNPMNFDPNTYTRLLTAAVTHGQYFQQLMLPTWLCSDYSANSIPAARSLRDVRLVLSFSLYLTIALIAKVSTKSRKLFGVFLTVCLPLAPASNIVFQVGTVVAERLLYLPIVGVALGVGVFADKIQTGGIFGTERQKLSSIASRVFWFLIAAYLLHHSFLLHRRIDEWKSAESVYLADAMYQPHSAKTQYNVGMVYMVRKEYQKAESAFVKSAVYDPMSILPYRKIGQCKLLQSDYKGAFQYLLEATVKFGATMVFREEAFIHEVAIAANFVGQKHYSAAMLDLASRTDKTSFNLYNNMACLTFELGNKQKAVEYIDYAMRLNKDVPVIQFNHRLIKGTGEAVGACSWLYSPDP